MSIGTRQGEWSSLFLYNILIFDHIIILSDKPRGINIDGTTYNVCCYADDLLLCSLSVTGLQSISDAANDYITEHGVHFIPSKTKCMTFDSCNLKEKQYFLNGETRAEENHVTHLWVVLANDNYSHTNSRLLAVKPSVPSRDLEFAPMGPIRTPLPTSSRLPSSLYYHLKTALV